MSNVASVESSSADSYTSTNLRRHTTSNPIYRWHMNVFHRRLFAFVQKADPDQVLDAGCGEGFSLYKLARRDPSLSLTGIDINSDAIAYARAHFDEVATFRQGTILDLPYDDNTQDLVLCSEVLEHLSTPEEAVEELKRVARSHVLITVPLEPYFQLLNDLGKWLGLCKDPGHVQFWNHEAFQDFILDHFDTVTFDRRHIYQFALCRVNGEGRIVREEGA